jgi:uncharacterized protein
MLPLGLRNRLAELILDAFDDPGARRTLEALGAFCASADGRLDAEARASLVDLGWFVPAGAGRIRLLGAHRAHGEPLCRRVSAALTVFRRGGQLPPAPSLPGLLGRAALLADAGLFFEVHELLEPAWLRADGAERLGLQALIQIAVAFHHAEHGNLAGASALLAEGLAKLGAARGALPLETADWEAGLTGTLAALREGRPRPPVPDWPSPEGARPTEGAWRSS